MLRRAEAYDEGVVVVVDALDCAGEALAHARQDDPGLIGDGRGVLAQEAFKLCLGGLGHEESITAAGLFAVHPIRACVPRASIRVPTSLPGTLYPVPSSP